MIWIYFNLNLWFEYIEYEFVYDIYDLSSFSQLYTAAHMSLQVQIDYDKESTS